MERFPFHNMLVTITCRIEFKEKNDHQMITFNKAIVHNDNNDGGYDNFMWHFDSLKHSVSTTALNSIWKFQHVELIFVFTLACIIIILNSLTNKHHVVISDNNTAFTNQSFIESPTNLPNLTKSPCHHSHTVMEFYQLKIAFFQYTKCIAFLKQ